MGKQKYKRPNKGFGKISDRRRRVVVPPSILSGFLQRVERSGEVMFGFVAPIDGVISNGILWIDAEEGTGSEIVIVVESLGGATTNSWKLKKGKNKLPGEFDVEEGDRILASINIGSTKEGEDGSLVGLWFGATFKPHNVRRSVTEEPDEGSTLVTIEGS